MDKEVDIKNKSIVSESITTEDISKKDRYKMSFLKFASFVIGLLISWLLYFKMLECDDCNIIVTAYFAIIGLCCFMNIGLPLDRLLSAYNN